MSWLGSRSPCGERGLKSLQRQNIWAMTGRSPCGERGLKFSILVLMLHDMCRSPCGERGLKFNKIHLITPPSESLPMRGAWIEI